MADVDGVCTVDDDGAVDWTSSSGPTVALTPVHVPDGVGFVVDAADPGAVLALLLPAGGQVEALRDLVDGTWVDEVARVVASGPGRSPLRAPGRLRAGWDRVATVEAVERWMLYPVDVVPLTIDRALAWHAVGFADEAARLLRQVSGTLVALGERLLDGDLTGAAGSDVTAAVALGARLLPDDEDRLELVQIVSDLDAGATADGLSTADVDAALRQLLQVPRRGLAYKGGRDDGVAGRSLAFVESVDPHLVAARTLWWRGAGEPDVLCAYQAGGDRVQLIVGLGPATSSEDAEARSMIAYAASADTGRAWSSVVMTVDPTGTALVGEVPMHGRDPGSCAFGVYSAGRQDLIRADPVGRELLAADRYVLDAWNVRRLAAAAATVRGRARQGAGDWSGERAAHLLGLGRERLARLADRLAGEQVPRRRGEAPQPTPLRRQVEDRLDRLMAAPGDDVRPLLAETLLLLDGPAHLD